MSVNSFNATIQNLSQRTKEFEFQSASLMGSFQNRAFTIETTEASHKTMMDLYTKTMNEVAALKIDINNKMTLGNQDEMILVVTGATDIESRLERAFSSFNDTLLTAYPTAKIEYGRVCVGPQKKPIIENANLKLQQLLKKCSGLREIRGDGNCFAAAFTSRFLETLKEKNAVHDFIAFVWNDGIDEPALKQEIITTLMSIQDHPSQLDVILGDNKKTLPFIKYFRHLAADEMKKNPNAYEIFFRADVEQAFGGIQEGKSYDALLSEYVLKMGVDFSQPSITALCQRLKFSIMIIDPNLGNPNGFNVLDNISASGTFCRNGAHYFVLYTEGEEAPKPIDPIIKIATPAAMNDIVINCKIPLGHTLFIRGSGTDLSWQKGIPMRQVDANTWIFKSPNSLGDIEYKFLINDEIWEEGENHKISQGKTDGKIPQFKPTPLLEIKEISEAHIRTTQITIKYHVESGNKLYIRGNGPGLSWEKGVELKNVGSDTWAFESRAEFPSLEYKILLNDTVWESLENHKIDCGKKEEITPKF